MGEFDRFPWKQIINETYLTINVVLAVGSAQINLKDYSLTFFIQFKSTFKSMIIREMDFRYVFR